MSVVCVCVREREREERERERESVCVCVCERERERDCLCVCEWVCECVSGVCVVMVSECVCERERLCCVCVRERAVCVCVRERLCACVRACVPVCVRERWEREREIVNKTFAYMVRVHLLQFETRWVISLLCQTTKVHSDSLGRFVTKTPRLISSLLVRHAYNQKWETV